MSDETPAEAGPVTRVRRDLRAIVRMSEALTEEAITRGDDKLMPGGLALVSLAPVANHEAHEWLWDHVERRAIDAGSPVPEDVEDDDWVPPMQTLTYWSQPWREANGLDYGVKPTMTSEATFLSWAAEHAYASDPVKFHAFAEDVRVARRRMEDLLRDGIRHERGVPCMYDECKGRRITRKLVPFRTAEGDKGWRISDWHCPNCKRSWDADGYARMVQAGIEATKLEILPTADGDGQTWVTIDYAARRTGRSVGTLRMWAHRGIVSVACIIAGRRQGFVNLDEVERHHAGASRRQVGASE